YVVIGARDVPHIAVGEPQIGIRRCERHLPANHAGVSDLLAGNMRHTLEASAAEVALGNTGYPISNTGISIDIRYIYIRYINVSVNSPVAITPAPPPPIKEFVRPKRPPPDMPNPTPPAAPAAESKKSNQSRRPVAAHADAARIPAPSIPRLMEPAAI